MFEKIFAIYVVIFPVLVYISLCFRCNSDDCKYIKRRGGQVTANIVAGIIIFLLEDMDKELQLCETYLLGFEAEQENHWLPLSQGRT